MSAPDRTVLLHALEVRHDELLAELEDLNRRIEEALERTVTPAAAELSSD